MTPNNFSIVIFITFIALKTTQFCAELDLGESFGGGSQAGDAPLIGSTISWGGGGNMAKANDDAEPLTNAPWSLLGAAVNLARKGKPSGRNAGMQDGLSFYRR